MTAPRIYRHTFFRGDRAVRWDTKRFRWGWYYALGWKKPSVKVYEWPDEYRRYEDGNRRADHIDALGGMMWQRLGPRPSPLFLCKYRAP